MATEQVIDRAKYYSNVTMSGQFGDYAYHYVEEINGKLHVVGETFVPSEWISYEHAMGESINDYVNDPAKNADLRIPKHWTHLEIGNLRVKSFMMNRGTDVGDNIKRVYKDGISYLGAITTAVGTTGANFLGLAYIPSTNRL